MNVCKVWLADAFLTSRGYRVEPRGDVRLVSGPDGTRVVPGVCRCPVEDCPPHQPAPPAPLLVMPWEETA